MIWRKADGAGGRIRAAMAALRSASPLARAIGQTAAGLDSGDGEFD